MRLKKFIYGFSLTLFLSANCIQASDDIFSDKTYQEGFNAGVAYAIAAIAYKKHGMADTPYPVELPDYRQNWENTVQMKTKLHACIAQHMERELLKAGGADNLLYRDVTNIADRVTNYCGG